MWASSAETEAERQTLLRHVIGLYLPTSGQCTTFGCPSDKLGSDELSRIGVVHQENRFLEWMKVEQQLRYVSSFYKRWDRDLEERLIDELELEPSARVGTLSPGNAQKLGIILAVCHRPDLLILDEPISGPDPITREQFLRFLLELLHQDANTIVISSHVLRDVEKVINRVICLDKGRIKADASLDDLQERFAEWRVTVKAGRLRTHFEENYVVSQEVDSYQARLLVKGASDNLDAFNRNTGWTSTTDRSTWKVCFRFSWRRTDDGVLRVVRIAVGANGPSCTSSARDCRSRISCFPMRTSHSPAHPRQAVSIFSAFSSRHLLDRTSGLACVSFSTP